MIGLDTLVQDLDHIYEQVFKGDLTPSMAQTQIKELIAQWYARQNKLVKTSPILHRDLGNIEYILGPDQTPPSHIVKPK